MIDEWTDAVLYLPLEDMGLDEEEPISLVDIAQYFFDTWTGETGWLFHFLEVELPSNLKHLLDNKTDENIQEEKWYYPGMMFCPRHQVIRFL